MDSSNSRIQDTFDKLTKPYKYTDLDVVSVTGARTVCNPEVRLRKGENGVKIPDLDPPLKVKNEVNKILKQWANGKNMMVLMSDKWPLHFGLPVRTYPPDCWLFQALCLGQDLQPLILTLYCSTSVDKEPEISQIEEFCMKCARMLTSSLLNFCCRDFILLPCTLRFDEKLTVEALQKKVDFQMDRARDFYGGPAKLGKTTFDEMVRAASIVASSTKVHCLLHEPREKGKERLLVMDSDLDQCLRLLIKTLPRGEHVGIRLNPKIEDNAKTAVLEAARRLSYSHRVAVVTGDKKVESCVKKLAKMAETEYGLDPSWFRPVAPGETTLETDCTISIDSEEILCHSFRSAVSEEDDIQEKKEGEGIRVLLVGKSGSGKSSTANTILGEQHFTVGLSFEPVTKQSDSKICTRRGLKIEVVDSPGIVNVEDRFSLECTHIGSSDSDPASPAGFDVVGYVVKIGRYTEEQSRAFERIKAVLGHKVTEHMIVIFTHSDSVEKNPRETLMKDAPEELKKVLRECDDRYVMFDNRSPKKKQQVEEFLKVARDLIQAKGGAEMKFICPSNQEIESRWNFERAQDLDRRLKTSRFFG